MPIVKFDTVSVEFSPNNFGLKEVSFDVAPGELVYISGPSGSGKTTLMRLLTKEYSPTAGDVFFEDQPISSIGSGQVHHHRRKIGVVFQDYQLIPEMNVWENIALPLSVLGKNSAETETRVTDLLNLINLPDKAFHFPSQLSGGEAQRVSIARALAIGPELIFADEPTGNLDAETSKAIAKLLHKVNQLGTTVLIATHDTDVLEHAGGKRHIKLNKGVLEADRGGETKSGQKSAAEENKSDRQVVDQPAESLDKLTKQADDSATDHEAKSRLHQPAKPSFWSRLFGKSAADKKSDSSKIHKDDVADKSVDKSEGSQPNQKNSKEDLVESATKHVKSKDLPKPDKKNNTSKKS